MHCPCNRSNDHKYRTGNNVGHPKACGRTAPRNSGKSDGRPGSKNVTWTPGLRWGKGHTNSRLSEAEGNHLPRERGVFEDPSPRSVRVVARPTYLLGERNAVARLHQRGLVLLADDVHAQFDALVADEHGRTSDELAHLVLALAAERAVERILGIATADFAHLKTPTRYKSSQP